MWWRYAMFLWVSAGRSGGVVRRYARGEQLPFGTRASQETSVSETAWTWEIQGGLCGVAMSQRHLILVPLWLGPENRKWWATQPNTSPYTAAALLEDLHAQPLVVGTMWSSLLYLGRKEIRLSKKSEESCQTNWYQSAVILLTYQATMKCRIKVTEHEIHIIPTQSL